MHYFIDFPASAGQFAGRHFFSTKKERATFMMKWSGVAPIATATLGKI